MKTVENEFGDIVIKMFPKVRVLGKLTQAPYDVKLSICVTPDKLLPEYMSFQDWIRRDIEMHLFITEELVDTIRLFLEKELKPRKLEITAEADNGGLYFPLSVTKTWDCPEYSIAGGLCQCDTGDSTGINEREGGERSRGPGRPRRKCGPEGCLIDTGAE